MEIVKQCQSKISDSINHLKKFVSDQNIDEDLGGEKLLQTQNIINAAVVDRDKNLDKILDQQASIKTIIETDNVIRALRRNIEQDTRAIEDLRRTVAKLGLDFMKSRSDLLETHAKDLERFQMHQLKSIAEDYRRHQEILEFRKKEIAELKKEIQREEDNREGFLASREKELEREIQAKQNMRGSGESVFPMASIDDDSDEPFNLELTSVNEYTPYGSAPGAPSAPKKRRQSTRGRGRGGRRGGASATAR